MNIIRELGDRIALFTQVTGARPSKITIGLQEAARLKSLMRREFCVSDSLDSYDSVGGVKLAYSEAPSLIELT